MKNPASGLNSQYYKRNVKEFNNPAGAMLESLDAIGPDV